MGKSTKPAPASERLCAHPRLPEATLQAATELPPTTSASLDARLLALLTDLTANIRRIADALDPAPPDIVGTPYVAKKLGCTTTWIADLIRRREVPAGCLVPGTGNGKPWKFYRARVEEWLASR